MCTVTLLEVAIAVSIFQNDVLQKSLLTPVKHRFWETQFLSILELSRTCSSVSWAFQRIFNKMIEHFGSCAVKLFSNLSNSENTL